MHTRRSCWYVPSDDCSVIVGISKASEDDLSGRRSDARKGVSRARPEEWRGKPRTIETKVFRSSRRPVRIIPRRAFFDTLAGASGGMADLPKYVYHLLPGNEDSLIRECLIRRPWWRPAAVRAPPERGRAARAAPARQNAAVAALRGVWKKVRTYQRAMLIGINRAVDAAHLADERG